RADKKATEDYLAYMPWKVASPRPSPADCLADAPWKQKRGARARLFPEDSARTRTVAARFGDDTRVRVRMHSLGGAPRRVCDDLLKPTSVLPRPRTSQRARPWLVSFMSHDAR